MILFERVVNDINVNPSVMNDSHISSLLITILWGDSWNVFFIIGGIISGRSSSYSRTSFDISMSEWPINDLNSPDPILRMQSCPTCASELTFKITRWISLSSDSCFFAQKFRFCNIENLFWKFWSINLTTWPYWWWFNIMSSLSLRGTQIEPICVQISISHCK